METYENETENSAESPKPSKKKEFIIMGLLGALLLGSLGYNAYQFQTNKEKSDIMKIDLKDTKSAKIALQNELDSITEEYEKTKGELNSRDSLLSHRDAEIFDKQKEIQNILNKNNVSEDELKQAKRMITALNADITRFKEEIAYLKQQNDSLIVQNDTLQHRQNKISEELTSEKVKAQEAESNIRSTFAVSNYQISGLRIKGNGKEVETDKAKKIDKLRVSFDLDPNTYAETGEKEIYIAVYKPDGSLGKFKDANAGQIDTWSLGTVDYSDKIRFNYQKGTKQSISFDWEDFEFPKGDYKIDLYQNGFKIGQKSLNLR